jgi:hypothetical protein
MGAAMNVPSTPAPGRRARLIRLAAAGTALLGLSACDLGLTNPNAPSETDVINTPRGILTTAVGIQSQYADNALVWVRAPALVTDEWGTRPRALAADQSLVTGNPDPSYTLVADPFAAAYRIARTADILVANAPRVGLGAGLQTGVVALAKLLKAMSLGNLSLQYERLPATYGDAAAPLPRAQVMDTVIALLESARADLATVTDADLAGFRSQVLGTGFDLRNTTDAMLARYYLFTGRYQQALDAANRVSPTVVSALAYPDPGINPIYNYAAVSQYVGARKVLFTEADSADRRPAYWANRAVGVAGLPDSVFDFNRYGGARNDPLPLYLPDEMKLIAAEANVRLGNLPAARTLVNAVRTQCTPGVTAEPVACLLPIPDASLDTADKLLTQILRERRFELFGQGLRWEDLRRLSAYTTKRPAMQFLPYPQSESHPNPAHPAS